MNEALRCVDPERSRANPQSILGVPGTTPRAPEDAALFPAIGEQGRAVLEDMGLDGEAIEALVAEGALKLPG